MKKMYYNLPRGSGKSTRMMYLSEHYQAPIICHSDSHKEYIMQQARKFGIDIPEPISLDELFSDTKKFLNNLDQIIIDESSILLGQIINRLIGKNVEILAETCSRETNGNLIRLFNTSGYKDMTNEQFESFIKHKEKTNE